MSVPNLQHRQHRSVNTDNMHIAENMNPSGIYFPNRMEPHRPGWPPPRDTLVAEVVISDLKLKQEKVMVEGRKEGKKMFFRGRFGDSLSGLYVSSKPKAKRQIGTEILRIYVFISCCV